jgi:hypothetical protein
MKLTEISGKKCRQYLKDRVDELAMNSKNKNIRYMSRGIN